MSDDKRQEAEQRYIAGEETLAEIAAGMKLPLSSVKRWCKAGDWVKKRDKFKKRALKKAVTQAANKKARELARLLEAGDEIEKALLITARQLAKSAEEHPTVFALSQSKTMLNVSESIERMAHARQMTGGAMTAADREKIDLLRRKQELEERKVKAEENREAGGVTFTLEKELDEITE